MKPVKELIAVALGEAEADFIICGAKVFNVFTGSFEERNVLVYGGYIAASIPKGNSGSLKAGAMVDASGYWLVPGFIDAHVHIESSMLSPAEYSKIAVLNGVTTLIADPHEISNICGADGISYMLGATEEVAARVLFTLPSCVPASHLEKEAIVLDAKRLEEFYSHPRVIGLGEMMNYPGVQAGNPEVLEKIQSVEEYNKEHFGVMAGLMLDGHAPFLAGVGLQAYAAAGIKSDHEASTVQEATERLAAGMGLMLREGSAAKNLLELVPAVNEHTEHLCMLCSDDRHAEDLLEEGSINLMVRKLLADGRLPLERVLRMASYNTARHFKLHNIGAIAPGYKADFALYKDLESWQPAAVWQSGLQVVQDSRFCGPCPEYPDQVLRNSVRLAKTVTLESLRIPDLQRPVNMINVVPYQLITEKTLEVLPSADAALQADSKRDMAKLAVFERHRESGRVGTGFVRGLGLLKGAVGSTVAHDAHNLVVAGMNDTDMFLAAKTLSGAGGGLVVCSKGEVLELLPLPLGGIFSDQTAQTLYSGLCKLTAAVRKLGLAEGVDPFMTLSFLALEVIPHIRLTDWGLVDVDIFDFIPLSPTV